MNDFPQTIHFIGSNMPRREEVSLTDLAVEGNIPPAIDGAFYRAVPDNAHPPMFEDDIALNADGMICAFQFHDGQVDFAIRYVATERYLAEKAAGRALFGRYRNPFTDDPGVAGMDRTVANTTPLWHAGQLFMTKEDGRAYEVNPFTLATIGKWDYGGKLRSETFTAHPRIDPKTGELFFFGYEAGGLCDLNIAYCIADAEGNLVREQWFEQPYCSTIHDFVITEKYAIWPIFPTLADLDRIKAGGPHWAHRQDLPSYVGIMPRYGDVSEIRWIEGPVGVSCFHEVNAFDASGENGDDKVHIDLCLTNTNAFPFMREAGGVNIAQQDIQGALTRWTIDLSADDPVIEERPLGPPGDLCRVRDADQGRPYNQAWYLSMNPQGGPPLPGGPVGVNFNALLRIETQTGALEMLGLPPGAGISEPAHVPDPSGETDGWLLSVVDLPNSPDPADYASELWILEADHPAKGPIAKVKTGRALRSQVHGTWVSRAKLDGAKHK